MKYEIGFMTIKRMCHKKVMVKRGTYLCCMQSIKHECTEKNCPILKGKKKVRGTEEGGEE